MEPLRKDLQTARELGVAVRLHLITGEEFLTGLHDWQAEEGWFSGYYPESLADIGTRTIMLDQVASWMVTDISYPYPSD